jgi:hypothetical protein
LAEKNIKIRYEIDAEQRERVNALFLRLAQSTDKADKEAKDLSKDAKKAGNDTTSAFKKGSSEVDKLTKSAKASQFAMNQLSGVVTKVGGVMAGAFAISSLINFGGKVISITAEFQKFEAVLSNSLGSKSLAQAALLQIQDFAAKTPFSVRELTEAYVQLANRGIKPSTATLTKLGDLASALGKPLDQVNQAILDVTNSERWTELGIKVKVSGDKIIGTFRGMTVESERSEAGALKLVEAFGEMRGVAGGMADVSETLGGKISNLGDAFDNLFNTIGKKGGGVIGFATSELSRYLNQISELAKTDAERQIEADNRALAEQVTQWEKLNLEQLNYLEKTKQRARLGAIMDNNAGGMLHSLTEEIHIIQDLIEKRKKLDNGQTGELGLLEKLRKELKEVTEAREKSTSEKEIQGYNKRAKFLQSEIDRLLGVGKAAERAKIALERLASVDFETGLTVSGEKLKAALSGIYKKIYGEQITASNEASDVTTKNSERFIKNVGDEINALATKANIEEAQRQFREQREKEELERRKKYVEEYTFAVRDLYSSLVSYQNQLDDQRIAKLEANKQRELAAAGDNVKEKNRLELQYDTKLREIRRRQAEREKRLAIFNAIINTAQGVAKALSQTGVAGIILGALIAAAGAVQIAAISSQQVPAYAKGTKSVPGKGSKDSEHAMLTPGEMVIPVSTKKKYSPILNAIFDHKIDPRILNDLVSGKSGGSQSVVVNDNKEVIAELKKIQVNKLVWDERGFTHYQEKGSSKKSYLNKRYSIK